jgi:hypothetical protein
MSPDWYSAAASGGNPGWNDPRWGSDAPVSFEKTFSGQPGSYIIVFDRAAGELAVTVRVTMGPDEAPDPGDAVMFAVASNDMNSPVARSATLTPVPLDIGAGPQALTPATSEYTGSWQSSNPPDAWLLHASEWRGVQGNTPSWVVNFRIKLSAAGLDPAKPFGVALNVQIKGAPSDLSTPSNLAQWLDQPPTWPRANLTTISCVARVPLVQ